MKEHGELPSTSEPLPSLTGEKPSIEKGFEMFGGEPSPLPEPDPSPPSDATTPVESVLGDISRPLIDAFSGEDLRSGDRPPGTPSEPAPAPKQWWIGDAALWLQSMMGGGKRADQGEPPPPPPDDGEGLEFPTVALPGVGEKSREEQMHEAFGTPLPEKPEPPLRVRDEIEAIRMFSPNAAVALGILLVLTLGLVGYVVLGRPAEQAPAGRATTQAAPTTASLPAATTEAGGAALRILGSEALVQREVRRVPDSASAGGIREDCTLTVWFVWKLSREPRSSAWHIAYQGEGLSPDERAPFAPGLFPGKAPDKIIRVFHPQSKGSTWSAALDLTESSQRVISPTDPGASIRVDGSCEAAGKRWLPTVPTLLPTSPAIHGLEGDYQVSSSGGGTPECRMNAYSATFSLLLGDQFDPSAPALLQVVQHGPVRGTILEGTLGEDGSFRFERSTPGDSRVTNLVYEGRIVDGRIEYAETATLASSGCSGVTIRASGSGGRI